MRILLGTYQLDAWAGSETYLLTVAEHLQQLGHDVSLYAELPGEVAQEARHRGLMVLTGAEVAASAPDALLTQDAATAYALAAVFPQTPHAYVAHSEVHALQLPPQLPGVVQSIIVMNGRVAGRIEATASSPSTTRLCQPVDLDRFRPSGALPSRPRRALLLGNYLEGSRRTMVLQACAEAALQTEQLGAHVGAATGDAAAAIADADIVIGQGRVIVEAMACGRAAYVLDQRGSGGWVTAASYPALEADGFAGVTQSRSVGEAEFRADLGEYSTGMGAVNLGLVAAHHDARHHANAVVRLLRSITPPVSRGPSHLEEMSRLVLLQWLSWGREQALARENAQLREGRDRAEAEYANLAGIHARSLEELGRLQEELPRPHEPVIDGARGRRIEAAIRRLRPRA